ncbi:MAG: hypothetical protein GXZ11_09330 [Tissierellia bacterium]|nr:hypothetical protein [Tissierellia bacterium]
MDWRKSKQILIVALIILNIFLYVGVRQKYSVGVVETKEKTMATLQDELLRSGIKIDAAIPTEIGDNIFILDVAYEQYNPRAYNEKIFLGNGEVSLPVDGVVTVSYKKEKIEFMKRGEISYENNSVKSEEMVSESEALNTIALDFFSVFGISSRDMHLDTISRSESGKGYKLQYGKIHRGIPLETAYTVVEIEGGAVVKMNRRWLMVEKEGDKPSEVADPYKVLFSLVGDESLRGKTIKSIELCNYFDDEAGAYITEGESIVRGRAFPAWRIRFDDGVYKILEEK